MASGSYGIWTHDPCDTGAVVYQLANWELVIMLVRIEPVKWWINDCEYVKMIYVNCGIRNEYESDLCRNNHCLSGSENRARKKAWTNL